MAEVERVRSSSASDAIGDPRAYLQRRVATFLRSIFLLFSGIVAFFLVLLLVAVPDRVGKAAQMGSMFIPPVVFGAAWMYARRGVRAPASMRGLEVAVTFLVCLFLGATPLNDPSPDGGTIGLIHTSAMAGCVVILRAAVVPSSPMMTLFVSVGCLAPAVAVAHFRSTLELQSVRWGQGAIGVIFVGIPAACTVAVATIVSKIVHGLETRVRKAMQLGQYTLEEKIGEGGMGAVYRARHALLRRPTAIKLLPAERAGDHAVGRFEREVQNTSRLTHPNTVAIYDFGRTPDGVFYYAMEYLEGLSLEALVEIGGPQPAARVLHVLTQAADALVEAHGLGLVHRDIKPANILLCERGGVPDTVKVLDFGLVKDVAAPVDVSLTATATITGTPLYLAPEALTDPGAVDARSDLYALGAVGYFLLTGELVFGGRSLVEVCSHHLHTSPKSPSDRLGKPVDADLEAIVLRCLAKKPEDRPADAAELGDALRACEASRAWSAKDARAWWKQHADGIAEHRGAARVASSLALIAVITLAAAACDRMPPPPAPTEPPLASASSRGAGVSPSVEALADGFLSAADTYSSRCFLEMGSVFESSDICHHIDHCAAGVKMNLESGPCGFTDAERAAVVGKEKPIAAALADVLRADDGSAGPLATYLRHAELFAQWVRESTDIGECIKRSPYGPSYCYEHTRGTVGMYQELARAHLAWRPRKDAFLLPDLYESVSGGALIQKLGTKTRRTGLRWGRCPSGMCVVVDQSSVGYGAW